MRRAQVTVLLTVAGFPVRVLAQELNATIIWLFVGAPLIAIMATVVAGLVAQSWKVLATGVGSIVFWIAWYWVAAQYAERDVLFWIPIVAIHVQAAASAGWLLWRLVRRTAQ